MAGFPKKERQRIVDEYLAEAGANYFVPSAFIDWLSDRPDHVAYPWFFGKDDATAAREYRIGLARQMAAGLRIIAKPAESGGSAKVIGVSMREYPAMISPMHGRRSGGGYVGFDPDDPATVSELQRQGVVALKSWLNRYGGVFGESASPVYALLEALEADKAA